MLFVGQDDGGGDGDTELFGEGVVEELVVGGPPEGVVDDDGAVEGGVLEECAIKGDVMGDAVHDDGVVAGLVEGLRADGNELGVDAVDVARVDVLDERAGKAVLHAEQHANLLCHTPTSSGCARAAKTAAGTRKCTLRV